MMTCQVSPAGYYAPKTTEAPLECRDGSGIYGDGYYSDVGMTYCLKCPAGFACPEPSGRHNVACKPGSTYTGDGTCEDCPAGEFCPIAVSGYRSSGTTCPDGTYAPEGSFDCEMSRPGYPVEADKSGMQVSPCAAGSYQLGGDKDCRSCPDNHECPWGETVVRCPIYFYSSFSINGHNDCVPCPDGSDCQDFTQ